MKKFRNHLFAYLLFTSVTGVVTVAQAASKIQVAIIVNGNAITNYDIERRIAFLRLQKRSGDLIKFAREELIDEMLRCIETKKHNISVSDDEINRAFSNFAERNNMTDSQLSQVLNQANVTPEHFKSYIQTQMSWGQLVSARFRAEGMLTEEEAIQRMLKNGGVKPITNEYHLQQVVFVIPKNRRSAIFERRRQEANVFRKKVNGCSNLYQRTKGIIDVTIKDLGRVLEPQIPNEWVKDIKVTPANRATPIRNTERGIESLVVCSIRKASDDRVAQLIFSIQNSHSNMGEASQIEKKYMKELRDKARIQSL
ncbi:MAG: peptidyl-prolyl cis-trans isomerase SurA [Candidatus Tokpelaia sp. JSC188]|nr:MAG: peptidyl-prolyl cis-trans isomerase SurA [Candidatus Tokpelaia sp. JSC188]